MPRCLPILTPFFDRFFIDFYLQLRSPEPSKSSFFLQEKLRFFLNRSSKLASIFDRFWCQHAFIFPPKVHQKPRKNRSQEASFFQSIFASIVLSIFVRFWRPTWSHVGHLFAQNGGPLWDAALFFLGSMFFFGFLAVLAPSWRHLGSIFGGLGLDFGRLFGFILEGFGLYFGSFC